MGEDLREQNGGGSLCEEPWSVPSPVGVVAALDTVPSVVPTWFPHVRDVQSEAGSPLGLSKSHSY